MAAALRFVFHYTAFCVCGLEVGMSTISITKQNFRSITEEKRPFIINFWAEWSGPCRLFNPIFDMVSTQYPDVMLARINAETENELAQTFNIQTIPTIVVYYNHTVLFAHQGAMSETMLATIVEKVQKIDMNSIQTDFDL
ncbi:MAG: thioredoxin family protein [Betaproteobacteria bacterium]|nr:thioredoxin family protein [Betaproteobacteria bacterium]